MLSSSIVLFEAFGQKLRLREALLSLLAGSVLLNAWLFSRLQSLDVNQQKSIHSIHLESLPANRANTGDTGLQCEAYGGPFEKSAVVDIVYWHDDIPTEQQFKSVYEPVDGQEKYFVFEPDEAGFSNVRLSFETVAAFSLAMGRTLVMPPKNPITQLTYQHPEGIRSYSFSDFFNMRNLTMISMQEYLERVALKDRLRDANGVVTYPPFRRTNWDTRPGEVGPFELELFYDWLSKSMHAIDWNRDECIIAFPANRKKGIGSVQTDVSNILLEDKKSGPDSRNQGFVGNPVPVNSSSYDRLREALGYRNRLCIYDNYWETSESLYMSGHERSGHRPLIQFYAYIFFEDWRQDLQMKRFMRDNIRLADIIQCAAARIVQAIRRIAKSYAPGESGNSSVGYGSFDTMHIRRSDFKKLPTYDEQKDGAERIAADKYFADQRVVYIATDERDKTWFEPLRKHYRLVFLEDFSHLIRGVDPNYLGMIEQLVCAKGDKFVGTYYSTFSGYINRVRGYHALKSKTSDAQKGILNSEYVGQDGYFRTALKTYMSASRDFWHREWPIGWRDIDFPLG